MYASIYKVICIFGQSARLRNHQPPEVNYSNPVQICSGNRFWTHSRGTGSGSGRCGASSSRRSTLNPAPYTLNPTPSTLHPRLYTLNPTPSTLNPKSQT